MKKLKSLTMFFPFYNDEGTVGSTIRDAYFYGKKVADDLEVIAIHGGASKDNTWKEILSQKKKHPDLVIIDKKDNSESYAVIKYGFQESSKEWVFYTDGDRQYTLSDLPKLVVAQQNTGADVVNGYKINRGDKLLRVLAGNIYQACARKIFNLPIHDLTCDFRLIRRSYLKEIILKAYDASILLELIKKLEKKKAQFTEVPVKHTRRVYGQSSYTFLKLLKERVFGDIKTYVGLKKNTENAL